MLKNLELYILKNVFDGDGKLKNIKLGKGKTYKYIYERYNTKYFVKLIDTDVVNNIKKIIEIYERQNIPIPKLIDIKYLSSIQKTCVVYEYIDGKSLIDYIKNTSCSSLEKMGIKIGKYLKCFNVLTQNREIVIVKFEEEINEMINNAYKLQVKYNLIDIVDLNRLFKCFNLLKKSVYSTEPIFIHGDITFNNILIKDDKYYFIDIEGGRYSFRSLNFKGNWWWTWDGYYKEKEQAIYRGIYKGMFNYNIPKRFHKELAFTMIYTFLCRLKKYKNNQGEVEYTFKKFQIMFERSSYFEKDVFLWF